MRRAKLDGLRELAATMHDTELAEHYNVSITTVRKHRKAEGVPLFRKGPTHGIAATYNVYGCRCELCRAAKQEAEEYHRAKRLARTASNGGVAPITQHGTASTASNWGCHCEPCRLAVSERNKRDYERRKNKDGNK